MEEMIEQLEIGDLSPEDQKSALDLLDSKIGEEIVKSLDEQQLNEYDAIIDGDQRVIDAWLDQNYSDYKTSPVYEEAQAAFEDDPEGVPPEVVVASTAWVEKNVPNLPEIVENVIEKYKQEFKKLTER